MTAVHFCHIGPSSSLVPIPPSCPALSTSKGAYPVDADTGEPLSNTIGELYERSARWRFGTDILCPCFPRISVERYRLG